MKNSIRLFTLFAALAAAADAFAWRQENLITNDIVQARDRLREMIKNTNTYDYITFEPGTYDLSLIEDDPIEGSSHWMGKTLLRGPNGTIFRSKTGKPEDVILDASNMKAPARVFLIQSGGEVQGITIKNANATNIKASYSSGSAIGTTGGSTCYAKNCRFIGCTSGNKGGAVCDIACENCYFEDNSTTAWGFGGALYGGSCKNCTFVNNSAKVDWCGGGAAASCSSVVDCTAISNSASLGGAFYGCKGVKGGTVNYNYSSRRGGAFYKCNTIADCEMRGNAATYGTALCDTSATNCVFAFNYGQVHLRDEKSYVARLEDCELVGNAVAQADLYRCRVHNVSNTVVLTGNVHYPDAKTNTVNYLFSSCRTLQNTLVTDCGFKTWVGNLALFYKDTAVTTRVENCTFADNTYPYFARGYGSSANARLSAVNTVAARNFNPSGEDFDLTGYESPCMAFTNCVLGRVDWKAGAGYGVGDSTVLGEDNYAKVKFQDEGDTPYAPKLSSPCRAKGKLLEWTTEDAIDLAGKPRLRDGKVDIGAYQCWLQPKGLMLIYQ